MFKSTFVPIFTKIRLYKLLVRLYKLYSNLLNVLADFHVPTLVRAQNSTPNKSVLHSVEHFLHVHVAHDELRDRVDYAAGEVRLVHVVHMEDSHRCHRWAVAPRTFCPVESPHEGHRRQVKRGHWATCVDQHLHRSLKWMNDSMCTSVRTTLILYEYSTVRV